jgi:hypothetical protein
VSPDTKKKALIGGGVAAGILALAGGAWAWSRRGASHGGHAGAREARAAAATPPPDASAPAAPPAGSPTPPSSTTTASGASPDGSQDSPLAMLASPGVPLDASIVVFQDRLPARVGGPFEVERFERGREHHDHGGRR